MKRKWIVVELLVWYISAFAALYIGFNVDRAGFERLWILPLAFACCFHVLLKCMQKVRDSLFFYVFSAVAVVRYVLGPTLHVVTGEYVDRYIRSIPSKEAFAVAIWLMAYELICCTVFLWFAVIKSCRFNDIRRVQRLQSEQIIMPRRTWVYSTVIAGTCVMTAMYPRALTYFSFFTFSFPVSQNELSTFGLMTQITVMLLITSKYLLFIMGIGALYNKYQKEGCNKWFVEICAFIFTILLGVTYYGGNRAQFLINLICSLYIFFLLFPQNRIKYMTISALLGFTVLMFMTEHRGYGDNYVSESGIEKVLLSLNQMIMEYFGGVDHVAVAVRMSGNYVESSTLGQLINDLLVPVVGLNKLFGVHGGMIANTLFNYEFFASVNNVTQILPSIGHGYFYFGFLFAPLIDICQLLVVLKFIGIHNKKTRIELIFLLNIVIMRFGLLFGQNISQQMNGISMQLMLPIIVYYLNNKLSLKNQHASLL